MNAQGRTLLIQNCRAVCPLLPVTTLPFTPLTPHPLGGLGYLQDALVVVLRPSIREGWSSPSVSSRAVALYYPIHADVRNIEIYSAHHIR